MSFSDTSGASNYFTTAYEGFATTANGQVSAGATTVNLNSVSGLTDSSICTFVIEPGETNEQCFTGVVDTSNSRITSVVWTRGTNVAHATGSSIVDYNTGTHHNLMKTGLLVEHLQTGKHGAVTATSLDVSGVAKADTISEHTGAAGVTIDGVQLKDNIVATEGAVAPAVWTNPYCFHATMSADLNNKAEGSWWILPYNTEVFDINNNFNTTTYAYTVPVSGIYAIRVDAYATDTTASDTIYYLLTGIEIDSSGTADYYASQYRVGTAVASVRATTQGTVLVPLTAGQVIKAVAQTLQTGTSAVNYYALGCHFSGHLVHAT